ncbi:IS66 family insertion sequence element accessory protein TnpA [Calditrichota bacterium LG25]
MSKADENRQDEMFKIIEAYQQSGLSQPAFCRQQGLNKSTFLYWLKKYRKEKQNDFLPINVTESKTSFNLELDLPNGIKIRIEG